VLQRSNNALVFRPQPHSDTYRRVVEHAEEHAVPFLAALSDIRRLDRAILRQIHAHKVGHAIDRYSAGVAQLSNEPFALACDRLVRALIVRSVIQRLVPSEKTNFSVQVS
jgi:hypothetical protein